MFATTSWSRVVRASDPGSPAHREALADLCRAYWQPLYAYARRAGAAPAEAEDGVQSFFAHLLERGILKYADPARGRFRGFLVASFRQFLAKRHEYETAVKRRPPGRVVSLDAAAGEAWYAAELTYDLPPDLAYEYAWAVAVLERVMGRLRCEFVAAGRADRFDALQGTLTGQVAPGPDLAARLGATEGAARVAVHRLRQRYGELLRAEVAATLGDGESVEDEIRSLLAALENGRRL